MPLEQHLTSFVLRFVCEGTSDKGQTPARRWRGVVRHVQSDAEQHFVRWEEAVRFMEQYVMLQQGGSYE
jgi:hypothetical protein